MALFSECRLSCAQIVLDTADIVRDGDLSTTTFSSRQLSTGRVFTSVSQAKLAIVLSDNPVALAGGVFKFLAVHDLHCATGVLDEVLLLQDTSCQAHGRSICP